MNDHFNTATQTQTNSMHNEAHESHPLISVILLMIGFISDSVSSFSMDQFYLWTFRIISLISVILVIIINGRKAYEELKKIFSRK